MEANGYRLSYQSRYLVERNWVQICLMGMYRRDRLGAMVDLIGKLVRRSAPERDSAVLSTVRA